MLRRQTEQSVSESRRQSVLCDVDLVSYHELQDARNLSCNRRFFPAPRGRRSPRFRVVFVHLWQPHTDDTPSPFSILHEIFNCGSANLRHR